MRKLASDGTLFPTLKHTLLRSTFIFGIAMLRYLAISRKIVVTCHVKSPLKEFNTLAPWFIPMFCIDSTKSITYDRIVFVFQVDIMIPIGSSYDVSR